jgi:hypothetical protein
MVGPHAWHLAFYIRLRQASTAYYGRGLLTLGADRLQWAWTDCEWARTGCNGRGQIARRCGWPPMCGLFRLGVNVFSYPFPLGTDPFCRAMRSDSILCLIDLILCQYYSGISVNVTTKNVKSPHLFKDFYSQRWANQKYSTYWMITKFYSLFCHFGTQKC